MSDPIGTVRREDHEGGHSIWVRQEPTYPDGELTDTEWTCVWSTCSGNIAQRVGDALTEVSEIIGAVPGTPAALSLSGGPADENECPYTHAHTKHWCGYDGCRES